jgi:hypothetical protein
MGARRHRSARNIIFWFSESVSPSAFSSTSWLGVHGSLASLSGSTRASRGHSHRAARWS